MSEQEQSKIPWVAIIGVIGTIATVIGGIVVATITSNSSIETLRVQNELNLTNTAIARTEIVRDLTLQAQLATDTPTGTFTPTSTETATPTPTMTDTAVPTNPPSSTPSPTLTETANVPTERPSDTESPTDPPAVINTPQPTNTVTYTPAPPQRAYPCDAQVDPNATASQLNIVLQSPIGNTIVASVRRGEIVSIIERSAGDNIFYRIQSNGRTIGWIAEEYLELSNNCPQ